MTDDALKKSLCGVWRLLRYWVQYDSDTPIYPLGTDAKGYIFYTPEGFMNGTMQSSSVDGFQLPDRLLASSEEKIAAFDSYLAYCGRWYVDQGKVYHQVEMSLIPNWIGDRQERIPRFDESGRLELRAEWFVGGRLRRAVIDWERAQ
jgi:hypothetical protein